MAGMDDSIRTGEERFSSQETKAAYQVRRRARELGLVPEG